MMPPVASGDGSPSTTPPKRTCERLADGYGATDVPWPITPIKTASFERPARSCFPNNCGEIRYEHRNPKTKSNPNTMCLQITLGEDLGSGHFYLAENRTFLLCVDMKLHPNLRILTPRRRDFAYRWGQ